MDRWTGINAHQFRILYVQFSTRNIHSIQRGQQYDGINAMQYEYNW